VFVWPASLFLQEHVLLHVDQLCGQSCLLLSPEAGGFPWLLLLCRDRAWEQRTVSGALPEKAFAFRIAWQC